MTGLGVLFYATTRQKHTPPPRFRATMLSVGKNLRVRALQAGEGDTTLIFLHGYGESLLAWRGWWPISPSATGAGDGPPRLRPRYYRIPPGSTASSARSTR
jgi:pimeloyl-ACP methyl ester carboxylesterase